MRESDFDCPHRNDAAAYVLGALEEHELPPFREHLQTCAQCRAEVAELQPVVDELPASVPQTSASEALRNRILETVRAESTLLHAAGHDADRAPARRRRLRLNGSVGAAAAVAAAVVIALVAILTTSAGGGEKVFRAHVSASAPGASATLRQRDGRAELVVSHMPQPGLGRIYEVWLSHGKGDAEPTSALFSVTSMGDGETDVPSALRGIRLVMVTSEPAGGSRHPTRKPLIEIPLSS